MSDQAARSALTRMHMREVAIAPSYTGLISDLRSLAATDPTQGQQQFAARRVEMLAAYGFKADTQDKPFAFAAGIAFIPVNGSLINRFGGSYSSVTGYNFIRSQALAAAADPDVKGIVFDINSYGGEAAGCFECAADLASIRDSKPTLAVVDSNAYSAAYAIASAASRIVVTPSGGAGSIGVVAMHVDMSKMLDDFGVKVTFIHSGDHKVDGNPYEALSDEVKADLQTGVDASRQAFVNLVAANRGLDAKVVFDTQARIYRAEAALQLGLIDAIASPSEAVRAFFDELSGSKLQPAKKGAQMSTEQKPGAVANADPQAATQAAANEARTAERARISGIQSCEEAKGREALASHLALNTDMSLEAAKGILAASPKAEAPKAEPAATNGFKAVMDASKHPEVGAQSEGSAVPGGESLAQQILRDQAMATGLKLVKA